MIYLDSSLVVAAITAETDTARVQQWLRSQDETRLCVSGWVATEVAGALAFKLRTGQIDASERRAALSGWESMRRSLFATEAITSDAFQKAAELFDDPLMKLRSGDALHIAIAQIGGHSLATLDKAMVEAAASIGIPVEPISQAI
jgi:uncharacterized protein